MIKVNLLKTKIIDVAATGVAIDSAKSDAAANRESLVKILMIVLFTAGLMIYENQAIRTLNLEAAGVSAQVKQKQNEAAAKSAEVEGVKDVEVRAKELEDKLKIIKSLSKLRLREVKTLDFMQSSIPEQVWLKSIAYESDRESVQDGKFVFIGRATTTEDLTEFVRRLDESAYLEEVIVIRNQEIPVDNKQTHRDFQMTAQVEKQR